MSLEKRFFRNRILSNTFTVKIDIVILDVSLPICLVSNQNYPCKKSWIHTLNVVTRTMEILNNLLQRNFNNCHDTEKQHSKTFIRLSAESHKFSRLEAFLILFKLYLLLFSWKKQCEIGNFILMSVSGIKLNPFESSIHRMTISKITKLGWKRALYVRVC